MAELVCCSWRDAVTDPPTSDWTGYVKTGDQIKILAHIVNGVVYVFSPHTSRAFTVVPGDQWLHVTDMPALPKEKVQAAVDEIRLCEDDLFPEPVARWRRWVLAIIKAHTGITSTEVTNENHR